MSTIIGVNITRWRKVLRFAPLDVLANHCQCRIMALVRGKLGENAMPRTIGQVVKELRAERGLSQYELAAQSNGEINRNWLASLERGHIVHPPSIKMEVLARQLHTTVTDIYARAGIIDIPTDLPPEKKSLLDAYDLLPGLLKAVALKLIRDLNAAYRVEESSEDDKPDAQDKKSAA